MEEYFASRIKKRALEPINQKNLLTSTKVFDVLSEYGVSFHESETSYSPKDNISTHSETSSVYKNEQEKADKSTSVYNFIKFNEKEEESLNKTSTKEMSTQTNLSGESSPSFSQLFNDSLVTLIENDNIYSLKKNLEDYLIIHMKAPDLKNDFENEFNQIASLLLRESQSQDIIVEREHELETEYSVYYNDILIRNKQRTKFFALELKQVRFTSVIDSLIKYYEEKNPEAPVLDSLKTYFDKDRKFNDNYKIYNEVFYGPDSIKNRWIMELNISKFFDEDKDPHNNIKIKNLPNLYRKRTKLYRKLIQEKYKTNGKVEIYYIIRIGPSKLVTFYELE